MNNKIGEVYVTDDYDLFKIKKENREINYNKVKSLMKLIEKDKRQIQPIIVNAKYEIFDGQHRFEALKNLKMPIKYFVDAELKDEDIITINNTQSSWRLVDYVHVYSEGDKKSFMLLEQLMDRFEFQAEIVMMAVKDKFINQQQIKSGNINITEEEYERGLKKLQWLKRLENNIDQKITAKKTFERTILSVLLLDDIDKDKLFKNIVVRYGLQEYKYGNKKECEQAIQNMYNYRNSNKRALSLEIQELSKSA